MSNCNKRNNKRIVLIVYFRCAISKQNPQHHVQDLSRIYRLTKKAVPCHHIGSIIQYQQHKAPIPVSIEIQRSIIKRFPFKMRKQLLGKAVYRFKEN